MPKTDFSGSVTTWVAPKPNVLFPKQKKKNDIICISLVFSLLRSTRPFKVYELMRMAFSSFTKPIHSDIVDHKHDEIKESYIVTVRVEPER